MCMEDVRISRSARVKYQTGRYVGPQTWEVPPNPMRLSLTIAVASPGEQIQIRFQGGTVMIASAPVGTTGVWVWHATYQTHPGILQAGVLVTDSTETGDSPYTEVVLDDEFARKL